MTHEERNTGKLSGNTIIGRQETRQKVRRKDEIIPLCNDGKKMKRIGPPKMLAAGQKNIVVTWTILHLFTYHTWQHGKSDQGVQTCLCQNSMMRNIQENFKSR